MVQRPALELTMDNDKAGIRVLRVLVTGASRGMGRAIAVEAASQGALVVAHYGASAAAARDLERSILDSGGRVALVQADWADPVAVKRAIAEAWEAFGGLDALVNNAGISMKKHFYNLFDLILIAARVFFLRLCNRALLKF